MPSPADGGQIDHSPSKEDLVILAPIERRDTLLHVIRSARRRLVLSLFRCDDSKVLDELAEALERNVQVEALITQKAKGWEKRLKDLRIFLENLGAVVHNYEGAGAKYHAKYLVVDDGPAVVASLNFTHKCFRDTCDFLLVTHDSQMVSSLRRLFEADCKAPDSAFPRNLSNRLIVGPDQARTRISGLLQQARRSIRIIDHRIIDPQMVSLLKDKKADGVTVEVLGRGEIPGLRSHGKMLLVDDSTALLGSISLSPPSLNNRREVAAVVQDPVCVGRLREFFETQYKNRLAPSSAFDDDDDDDDDEDS